MNESDWNNDFDEDFDEVLRASVSSSANRFYNKSPVKDTLQDDVGDKFRNLKINNNTTNDTKKTKNFITLQDFNDMKRQNSIRQDADGQRTLSKEDFMDGFDDMDHATIKAGNNGQRAPSKKKSLRFLDAYNDQSDVEDDIEFPQDFQFAPNSSPNKFYHPKRDVNPDHIQLSSSPSRSTSSSVSLNNFSETDDTDNEFIEGFEINNNINLLKQYQMRKEKALHQAQIEYNNAMKYNSLLHRKVQSSNNIARYKAATNEEDENFMDGFDPISSASFQRPKRPDQHSSRGRVKHSQSSYTLRGKNSMPVMRNGPDFAPRKLKHSASNYFDVYRGSAGTNNPLDMLGDNYRVHKFGEGDELENFNDLTEDQDETLTRQDKKSIRKLINLANYMEVYSNPKPKKAKKRTHSPSKPSRNIGLIKQLSNANSEKIYHNKAGGDMRYNPQTYRWEGNDVDLSKFENANARPALINSNSLHTITKKQPGQRHQIIGNMAFNPDKMCWINLEKDANNDENDPFRDLEDLQEDDPQSRSTSNNANPSKSRGVSSSSVMTSSTVADRNRLGDIDEEDGFDVRDGDRNNDDDPFNISRELIYRFKHEEMKWNKKVKNWFQPEEIYDRDYAYEIRRMVTDNV